MRKFCGLVWGFGFVIFGEKSNIGFCLLKRMDDLSKHLIPWRDPIKGVVLKLSLLKLVQVKGLHLMERKSGIDNLWKLLIMDLLRQPEWAFLDPASSAPISHDKFRAQYKTILDEACKKHGWGPKYGGSNSNLSGDSGDLDELSTMVKQVMMEIEHKNAVAESAGKQAQCSESKNC